MTGPADFYTDFAQSLLSREPTAAPGNLDADNRQRFTVYRNNVYKGFIDALGDAYPVVKKLVGEEFFQALAREYYWAAPRGEISLALYGGDLPAMLDNFPPAKSLPYLADVARLERAWLEAYHAADAIPLDAGQLTDKGDRLPELSFRPHPAARLLVSAHPVLSIWQANRGDNGDGRTVEAKGEAVLIIRPYWDVVVTALSPEAAEFTRTLLQGSSVGEAYEAATAQQPHFDVTTTFGQLLAAGVFTDLIEGNQP